MTNPATTAVEPAPAGVLIDGTKVRELRQDNGMELKDLADKARISFQYLSQIERGDRPRVGAKVFCRLADALGIADRRTLRKVA